jgi:hypothetical protein
LSFASKTQAKIARARILEEQCGADWPPFAVGFASTVDIALMRTVGVRQSRRVGVTPLSRPMTVLAPPPAQGLLPSCVLYWTYGFARLAPGWAASIVPPKALPPPKG